MGNIKDEKNPRSEKQNANSAQRKRLHILYLINDLLHHTKYHVQSTSDLSTLAESLWTYVIELLRIASAHDSTRSQFYNKKIEDLITIWAAHGYYDDTSIQKFKDIIVKSTNGHISDADESSKTRNGTLPATLGDEKFEIQCLMPTTHGDSTTPYYDLPAGNMMPHIVPNLATPINPQVVKPLQFGKGSAKEDLVTAIKKFMKDISLNVGSAKHDNICVDINDLGQPTFRDGASGDLIVADGYYGWSRGFCEKMRSRRNITGRYAKVPRMNKDAERSWSPRKRPRYNRSESSDGSDRSRSSSAASYLSPPRRGASPRQEARPHSYSRGRSSLGHTQSSASRLRSRSNSRARLRSTTRSNSYSPPPPPHLSNLQQQTPNSMEAQYPQEFSLPHPNALPPPMHQSYPLGPGGVLIPPPPPLNFKGIWPPPPPPPPAAAAQLSRQFVPSGSPYSAFQNFAPPHPPVVPNPGHFPFVQGPPDYQIFSRSANPRPQQDPPAPDYQSGRYS